MEAMARSWIMVFMALWLDWLFYLVDGGGRSAFFGVRPRSTGIGSVHDAETENCSSHHDDPDLRHAQDDGSITSCSGNN
jgi:hypothetical protein